MPSTDAPEPISHEERFAFLFPANGRPRYRLCAPDVCELRWSVFDQQEKRTVAFGTSPERAVDYALERRPAP